MNITQHQVNRSNMWWGTYGKNPTSFREEDVTWVRIRNLSNPHIEAILKTQPLNRWWSTVLKMELIYRKESAIFIPDTDTYLPEDRDNK